MMDVKRNNFFDEGILVVDEYFEVVIPHQVEIYFVAIVADGHDKRSVFVKSVYFFVQRQFIEINPRNHAMNID